MSHDFENGNHDFDLHGQISLQTPRIFILTVQH